MAFVSVTRLRMRSIRYLPAFGLHAFRSNRQVSRASGFRRGSLLADRSWTFWTMTAWESEDAMRVYMMSGAHRLAMPHLLNWCDEASLVHWDQAEDELPTWLSAYERLRHEGRASKVRYPSPRHAGLAFETPRVSAAIPIRRATNG